MKLTAKPVQLFCTEFNKITRLQKSAFPKKEQTPMFLLLLGALRKSTHFTAFYCEDKFAGLLYTIDNHYILRTKEQYPTLHPTYEGQHYSEYITVGQLQKLYEYLSE